MAKVTKDHIKAGAVVFMVGYRLDNFKDVPLQLKVIDGKVDKHVNCVAVEYASSTEQDLVSGPSHRPSSNDYEKQPYVLYLGDLGIKGFNYDSRATQLFTTKEEAQEAIKLWDGRNPNFITDNGADIER